VRGHGVRTDKIAGFSLAYELSPGGLSISYRDRHMLALGCGFLLFRPIFSPRSVYDGNVYSRVFPVNVLSLFSLRGEKRQKMDI